MAGKEDNDEDVKELLVQVRDKLLVLDDVKKSVDELKVATSGLDGMKQSIDELKADVTGLKDAVRGQGALLENVEREVRVIAEGHTMLVERMDAKIDEKTSEMRAQLGALLATQEVQGVALQDMKFDLDTVKTTQQAHGADLKTIKADVRVLKGRVTQLKGKVDRVNAKLDLKADKPNGPSPE